jgi:hypothetical protein
MKKKMDGDSSANVYSEAKSEYMLQLCSYLTPAYFNFYLDLLEKAKETMKDEPRKYLWQFQNLLAEVEDWNMEKVGREVNNIVHAVALSGCDFLDDLLTAVFIAHTKVLMAIRLNSRQKKIQITVPKLDHFLFKVFCECSRLLWQSAYLLRDNIGGMEQQQNYRQVQALIENGIKASIRTLVPVKSLLKDCINPGTDSAAPEDDSDSDDDTPTEAHMEAHMEAPVEASVEAHMEAPMEAPMEASMEAPVEAPMEAPMEAPVEASVEAPMEAPIEAPIEASVEAPMEASIEAASEEKLITELPIDKRKVNVTKQNVIVVDDEEVKRNVSFNEYETIFDMDNEDGHHIQPATNPELENRPPEEDEDEDEDEDESLKILDDEATPLTDDDFDDPNDLGSEEALAFDDFDELGLND